MIALMVLLVVVPIVIGGIYKVSQTDVAGVLDPSAPPVVSAIDSIPLQPKTPPLSKVAKEVLNEYNSLPIESRPFDNIEDILASLDAVTNKFGKDKRDEHFDDNASERQRYENFYRVHSGRYAESGYTKYPFRFSWHARNGVHCAHNEGVCNYADYVAIHREIEKVKKALDEKAVALVESENAHNVSMAKELAAALRTEAGIQTQVTQEIRGK